MFQDNLINETKNLIKNETKKKTLFTKKIYFAKKTIRNKIIKFT